MDSEELKQNVTLANTYQYRNGYSPKPDCEKCKGYGRVHPVMSDKIIYVETMMCDAPGCMKESFNRRGL